MTRWAPGCLLILLLAAACAGGAGPTGGAPPATPASGASASQPAASGAAASAPAAPPAIVVPPTKVRASYSVISGGIAAYWVAAEAGLWQQHGLDVDFVYISGTPASMAALISGETQFAVAAGDAVLRVQAQNPDVVSLVTTTTGNTHRLMVVPEIQRLEDLTGRRIGVAAIGDGAYAITSKALLKLGYNPAT